MTQRPPRRFGSTEHLAAEAIAAYVDGELRFGAYMRAANHIAMCPECAAEVEAQAQARRLLRGAEHVAIPHSLLSTLNQIPTGEIPICGTGRESKRWSLRKRR